MSISSISSSSMAISAANFTANQTPTVPAQFPVAQTDNQGAVSQTTVTLSPAAAAYAQAPAGAGAPQTATQIAAQDAAASSAQQYYNAAKTDSQAILGIGQNNMATAMQTFGKDWDAEKQVIAAQRPDLLSQRWDIVTDQGTIQVVSSTLSSKDKAWLSAKLNQDPNLVADTQAINTVMLSTFSGTADMAASDPMGITLSTLNQGSIDGTVHFLTLLSDADKASYDISINEARLADPNLTVIAPAGGAYNNPYAGNISAIADLDPLTANEGTEAFPFYTKIQAAKSDATQHDLYGGELNDAFATFLVPAFGSALVADGSNVLQGSNLAASDLPPADTSITQGPWWQGLMHGGVTPLTMEQLKAEMTSVSNVLGANARSYGEGLAADNTAAAATDNVNQDASQNAAPATSTGQANAPASASADSTTASTAAAAPATGVGTIKNVFQEDGQVLSAVQKAIQPAMVSLGNDWNAVKAVIAAKRPDLLNQNWDFVTDNGTVQVVSSSLTDEQKAWLTGILNQNQGLVADTQTINQDLVNFYKTTPLGNGPDGQVLPSLTMQDIDGIIPFLKLMSGVDPATLLHQGLANEMQQTAT